MERMLKKLDPTEEQKQRMLRGIMEQYTACGEPRKSPRKRWRTAVLAAAIACCLITTTAFAAVQLGLDAAFVRFLHPSSDEQKQQLESGAYLVDQTAQNASGAVTIKQVVGDSNLVYILMELTAPEGTVLDKARYRYAEFDLDLGEDMRGMRSTGFIKLEDENGADNQISLIMEIMTDRSLAGQKARLTLSDLQGADAFPGEFETVLAGEWQVSFPLDFTDCSTQYEVNRAMTMLGEAATVRSVTVSPIAITLRVDSPALRQIYAENHRWQEVAPNEYLDDFPITIHYADGTTETTKIFNGLTNADYLSGELLTIKTFENVINDKAIRSITFFDEQIELTQP